MIAGSLGARKRAYNESNLSFLSMGVFLVDASEAILLSTILASIIIIIITLQYDVHVIEGESLQSVSEQVVGVHTDRICQVDIPGLKKLYGYTDYLHYKDKLYDNYKCLLDQNVHEKWL